MPYINNLIFTEISRLESPQKIEYKALPWKENASTQLRKAGYQTVLKPRNCQNNFRCTAQYQKNAQTEKRVHKLNVPERCSRQNFSQFKKFYVDQTKGDSIFYQN